MNALEPKVFLAVMSPEDTAWTAGLFEGEGSIQRQNGHPRLHLGMTDSDVVERFATLCGKNMTGPYYTAAYKPLYRWSEGRSDVVSALLAAWWPYLGERRRARAIELGEMIGTCSEPTTPQI